MSYHTMKRHGQPGALLLNIIIKPNDYKIVLAGIVSLTRKTFHTMIFQNDSEWLSDFNVYGE